MRGSAAAHRRHHALADCPIARAEKRLPFDVNRAKQLLAEAGYPNGFEVTLDCPNNRYVNDEQICLAVAAMMTRVGIQTKVTTMPRATYFPKLEKFETSMYMLGWGGGITDAQSVLSPVLRSLDKATGQGGFNYGRYSNPKLDALIDAAASEMNVDKRKELIRQALAEHNANAPPCATAPADDSVGDAGQHQCRPSR